MISKNKNYNSFSTIYIVLSLGCLFHGFIPIFGSYHSICVRIDFGRRKRWNFLLFKPRSRQIERYKCLEGCSYTDILLTWSMYWRSYNTFQLQQIQQQLSQGRMANRTYQLRYVVFCWICDLLDSRIHGQQNRGGYRKCSTKWIGTSVCCVPGSCFTYAYTPNLVLPILFHASDPWIG